MALPWHQTLSVEEYFALDSSSEERYEYLNGDVYMLAGGSPNHAIITVNLGSMLKNLLRGRSCRVYSPDVYFYLSEKHYVHPDVSVSCNEQDRKNPDNIKHPSLIIEVLSPTTEGVDRGKKFGWYRSSPSIQEYVLVASEYKEVQVYQHEQKNLWTLRTFGPDDTVELTRLGVSFSVADIYEDTFFPEET
ncbi:MAG: Uma2 family endonuclease [Ktedonobacteraceae bacterium]